MADATGQLDTHIEIVTPENIAFQYRVAGPFRRLPAFLIDLAIRVGVAVVGMFAALLAFGAAGVGGVGFGLGMLLWFLLAWFYGGLFETFWNGQTPGKRLMKIRVVSIEGQPITPLQAVLRNILREIDAQPLWLYQIGLLAAMSNRRFQRLGDLASGTMVVVDGRQQLPGVVRTGEPEAVRVAALVPPSFQPSRSLARALAAYAQRRRLFPWGRRMEIARHLGEPLRQKFQLPVNIDLDLLLCGLYHRTFIADRDDQSSQGSSPFREKVGQTSGLPRDDGKQGRQQYLPHREMGMKVVDLLESRREQWRELEQLCAQMERRRRRTVPADTATRFSTLYRAACADLALADAYQLPPASIDYLHQLVGRAHNQLYRSQALNCRTWFHELLVVVPRRLLADRCLWLAAGVFWGVFLLAGLMAGSTPGFAEQVLGKELMTQLEDSFSKPVARGLFEGGNAGSGMAGFYVFHNVSIGLQCFAFGLLLGIGGLYVTLYNAAMLGAVFGFMARSPHAENFYQFVTAHGPFELTAVVLCAAAGMRLGFSLVDTHGLTRAASLRQAAAESSSTVWAAVVLFVLAAMIEAFLSPSAAPYAIKAAVAVLSCVLLVFYFVVLGYPRKRKRLRMTRCNSTTPES